MVLKFVLVSFLVSFSENIFKRMLLLNSYLQPAWWCGVKGRVTGRVRQGPGNPSQGFCDLGWKDSSGLLRRVLERRCLPGLVPGRQSSSFSMMLARVRV